MQYWADKSKQFRGKYRDYSKFIHAASLGSTFKSPLPLAVKFNCRVVDGYGTTIGAHGHSS
jgi:hypothetical protein